MQRFGQSIVDPDKIIYLLAGDEKSILNMPQRICYDLQNKGVCGGVMRLNMICDRNCAVDPSVPAGEQIVDAVMEIWLPKDLAASLSDENLSTEK
jgi:hypothetical protein